MQQIEAKFKVRYSETDQMKIVHHSNYAGETMHAWTNKFLEPVNAKKKIPEVYGILSWILKSEF